MPNLETNNSFEGNSAFNNSPFNSGNAGFDAISGNNQYLSPFMKMNGALTGTDILTNKRTSLFPFTGNDVNGTPRYEYFVDTVALDDGAKVFEAYEKDKPEQHTLRLFYEHEKDGKSNLFGSFYVVKMGDSFKGIIDNLLRDRKYAIPTSIHGKKATDVNSFEALAHYVNSAALSQLYVKSEDKADLKTPEFSATYNAIMRAYHWKNVGSAEKAISSIDEMIAGGLSWCADKLENFLFTEKDYMPSQEKTLVDDSFFKKFADSDIFKDISKALDSIYDYIAKALVAVGKKIMDILPAPIRNLVEKIQQLLQWIYSGLETIAQAVLQFVEKFAEIIAEILLLARAFLYGIINGIIGLVQTILRLLAFLIDMSGNDIDYESYLRRRDIGEKIESVLDFIYESFSGIIDGVKNLFTQSSDVSIEEIVRFFQTVGSFFAEEVVDFWNNTSRYKLAYWGGIFIFEVIINVVLALVTGGAGNIARAGTHTEKLTAFIKLWSREAFSVATLGVVDILAFFKSVITSFIKACSKGLRGFFRWIDELIKIIKSGKAKNGEELLGEAEKAVGMAENIKTTINVEDFLASAKRLENIKPDEALKYLDEALVHFNHEIVDGVVVQIGDENCALIVQAVEEYLKTGEIRKALPSEALDFEILESVYDKSGLFLENFTIERMNQLIKDGERGIIAGLNHRRDGHVINFIKENGVLKLVDGQNAQINKFVPPKYDLYKYFKTVKL